VWFIKEFVTASYISEAMQELDAAKENNLVFMNEIGLDPGIDHMSAMKVIDEIRDKVVKAHENVQSQLPTTFCRWYIHKHPN
jgi:saccharopine dehydrogenase-like NADP-dependent oxidoreductase